MHRKDYTILMYRQEMHIEEVISTLVGNGFITCSYFTQSYQKNPVIVSDRETIRQSIINELRIVRNYVLKDSEKEKILKMEREKMEKEKIEREKMEKEKISNENGDDSSEDSSDGSLDDMSLVAGYLAVMHYIFTRWKDFKDFPWMSRIRLSFSCKCNDFDHLLLIIDETLEIMID